MLLTKENIFAANNLLETVKEEVFRKINLKKKVQKSSLIYDLEYFLLEINEDRLILEEKPTNTDFAADAYYLTWEEFLDPEFDNKINSLLAAKKKEENKKNRKKAKDKQEQDFALYQKLKKKFEK